jgi:hypothetical protein
MTQFESRSFTEFILSVAEGFRMTTPLKCHSERAAKNLLTATFSESLYWPAKMSHYEFFFAFDNTKNSLIRENHRRRKRAKEALSRLNCLAFVAL